MSRARSGPVFAPYFRIRAQRARGRVARCGIVAALSLAAAGCTGESAKKGPDEVEFGLDERPVNATCHAPARPATAFDVVLARVFAPLAFTDPVFVLPHPTVPDRWYVIEQGGTIQVFDDDGSPSANPAYTQSISNPSPFEGGLLGFAFHPDFETNGRAFISYTAGTSPFLSHIREITSSDGGQTFTAPAASFITVTQPFPNHNGGMIAFGPDGYLYSAFGDGGSGNDPNNAGQDTATLLGKILRIDVDPSSATYTIPADNPFEGSLGDAEEIFAWGFRNPWRFSFDTATGELWAGDVGQDAWEEIDRVQLGGNYGWKVREGAHCRPGGPAICSAGGLIEPVVEHPQPDYTSITGGYVYRGTAIPALEGVYLYGDFSSGDIHGIFHDPVDGLPVPQLVRDALFRISSFGQGNDGEVYVVDYDGGGIHKLVPGSGGTPSAFPQLLSETGCFDVGDPTEPAEGLIPYEINAPLWSDGAEKRRWMALPNGETITVDADTGDWTFPEGTVLVKEFSLDDERLETRLLVLHTDGNWAGYSYEWNENETDAALLPAGKTLDVGAGRTWGFPSRAECLQCHTGAAGRSLGLETAQMNRPAAYPGNVVADQMNTLEHIGLFTSTPARIDPLPDPADTTLATEARARAYLHANCSNCHRPGGTGQGSADFRHGTVLAAMGICDAVPQEGDLGVPGAALLSPGDPSASLISLRMKALDSDRMPDVGSRAVDPLGTQLVDAWIEGIATCP